MPPLAALLTPQKTNVGGTLVRRTDADDHFEGTDRGIEAAFEWPEGGQPVCGRPRGYDRGRVGRLWAPQWGDAGFLS